MAYLIDKINVINDKKVILLLDRYSVIDKSSSYFQTLQIKENTALYVSNESLGNVKNADSTTPCYGFWQLLFLSKQIDFEQENNLLVVYEDDIQTKGLFLYYNHADKDYRSGLIVNEQFIGLFGANLPSAQVISVDEKKMTSTLSNEILRPLDRYKKEQALIKTAAIYGLASLASIAGILFIMLSFVVPYSTNTMFSSDANTQQELVALQQKLQRATLDLRRLKNNKVSVDFDAKPPEILGVLSEFVILGVPITLSTDISQKQGKLIFQKLEPWMSQLPRQVFKIAQIDKKIHISWNTP